MTELPPHAGIQNSSSGIATKGPGPITRSTMSLEALSEAQAQIRATVKERDDLRNELAEERREHNRALDRIQLLQVQLEKTEADRDMYLRASVRYVTLIRNIHLLSAEAKSIAEEAQKQGLIETATTDAAARQRGENLDGSERRETEALE